MKLFILIMAVFFSSLARADTEYIIKFKNNMSQKSIQVLSTMNVTLKTTIPQLNLAVVSGVITTTKELSSDIEYIEKNGTVSADVVHDSWQSEMGQLWGMKAIKLSEAWPITHGDRKIIVAVSDTGIWRYHDNLKDNMWINPGESGKDAQGKDKSKNKIDDDGNGFIDDVYGFDFKSNTGNAVDGQYHGSHVAGTIGAVGGSGGLVGVAGRVSLMSAKFLGADGNGTDEDAIRSIIYAVDNGARIINCSWGSDEYSKALFDAVDYAKQKGVIIVAAAGNDGDDHDIKPHYPSGYALDNVMSVAATYDAKGRLAHFSNYGAKSVNIAAPGDFILSTFNPMYTGTMTCENGATNSNNYCVLSGTSMATPHVSGALAMVYAANPKLTYLQARQIILSTASSSSYLVGKVTTGGQLDVAAAVRRARESVASP